MNARARALGYFTYTIRAERFDIYHNIIYLQPNHRVVKLWGGLIARRVDVML
jgi:hypothetical protein